MKKSTCVDANNLASNSPEHYAFQLLASNKNIKVKELQELTGLSWTQASLLKRGYISADPELIAKAIYSLTKKHVETVSSLKIVEAKINEHLKFECEDTKPIGIAFIGDTHCGSMTTAHELLRSNFELIANTAGMYAVGIGDYIDNFVKFSMASVIIDSETTPDFQQRYFEELLELIEDKVISLISGNHDLWSKGLAGIDVIKRLAESHRIPYAPHQMRIQVELPGVEYSVGIRHKTKSNSAKNAGHGLKTWLREQSDYTYDILCCGHTHESVSESFWHLGRERFIVRPGSMKVMDDFGLTHGFASAMPTIPVAILYPSERKILAFSDIRAGAEVLTALRDMKPAKRASFYPEVEPLDIPVVKAKLLDKSKCKAK